MKTTVAGVQQLLDSWYDQRWAEAWDTVGLAAGDPTRVVDAVHIAVDPTEAVAHEAVAAGAQLLITHHPLWLGGTTSVATSGRHGQVLAALTAGGCALYVAHTNADVATPGVSDALAETLGLSATRPLSVQTEELDQWVVHVPTEQLATVGAAMSAAGAGRLGDYDQCAFISDGYGSFRPGPDARPFVGTIGEVAQVAESRLEMVAAPKVRAAVARAIRAAHPYEEPSMVVVTTSTPSRRGLGRVGTLDEPVSLAEFVRTVAHALPATATGVRATGDPHAPVRVVAVAGGACLDLVDTAVAAGADVFVTSDAKHHRAQEAPIPVVDVAHWAGEWPWTAALGARLRTALPVAVGVSRLVTDPWSQRADGDGVGTGL